MKSRIALISILIVGLACHTVQAQNEGTLYLMNSLPQVVYLNPAFVPKYKISVGIPGSSVTAMYSNNGFSYNDLVTKEAGVATVDLDRFYSKLKPKNFITLASGAELFRLSLKVHDKFYLTWNVSAKTYARLMLPKDLTGIFIKGTAPFIGSTATLAPKIEALAFLESAIGGAYKVDDNLVLGARVKLLKGIVNANSKRATLNLSVDQSNYAITMKGDADIQTSGINNMDNNEFSDFLKNNGLGIDLGATYRLMDKINLSASIVDLGFIKWKNDGYSYKLDPAKAKYTFDGIDLNKVLTDDADYLETIGDSISTNFEFQEGKIASYKTSIPTKIYVGGNYELEKDLTAGIVLYSEIFGGRTTFGTTLGVNRNFGKYFTATGSYTISSNSFSNIGLGTSLNLSPIQLYFVGDNILSPILGGRELNNFLNRTQMFNIRVGLNFVFKWDKGPEKAPSNNESQSVKLRKKK